MYIMDFNLSSTSRAPVILVPCGGWCMLNMEINPALQILLRVV